MTSIIPKKGVLFLGGHQNMVKKLQQRYPKWRFITDDYFGHRGSMEQLIVFFWTAHCSHKMMQFVYSKLNRNATVYYVTATNLDMLENEMINALQNNSKNKSYDCIKKWRNKYEGKV